MRLLNQILNPDKKLQISNLPIFLAGIILFAVGITLISDINIPLMVIALIFILFVIFYFKLSLINLFIICTLLSLVLNSTPRTISYGLSMITFGLLLYIYFGKICTGVAPEKKPFTLYYFISAYLLISTIAMISLIVNQVFDVGNIFEVIKYLSFGLLILILYENIVNVRKIKSLVIILIVFSILLSTYGYWLLFTLGIKKFIILGISSLRAMNTGLGNPNVVATVTGFPLPLVLSYILFGNKRKLKRYAILLLVYIGIITLMWNSRATYLYATISSIVLFSFHKKKAYFIAALISLILIIQFAISEIPIISTVLRFESGLSHREWLWQGAFRIFTDHPIIGGGAGSFYQLDFYYMAPSYAKYAIGAGGKITAHNLLLHRAAELGFFAVLITLLMWWYICAYFIKNAQIMKRSEYYSVYLGCGAGFIGMIFKLFFEASGNVLQIIMAVIMIAAANVHSRNYSSNNA